MRTWFLAFSLLLATDLTGWAGPLRVAVISDLNGSYGSLEYSEGVRVAVARITKLRPDLVISTGDLIAGQRFSPRLNRSELDQMWGEFRQAVADPLAGAGIPLVPTPGNHDASAYDGFEEERSAYQSAWEERPDLEFIDSDHYPFRYAFRLQGVVFVSLDATRSGRLPPEQIGWLRGQLERATVSGSQKVIFGHLPVWPVTRGRESEFLEDPQLRALFREYSVDLYLSGHHHAFYPGQDGPTLHLSNGCLGSGPRKLIGSPTVSPRSFTLVEIADNGTVAFRAYREPGYLKTIELGTLPEMIETEAGALQRAVDMDRSKP